MPDPDSPDVPPPGLYWIKGLTSHARGVGGDPDEWFDRDLALESRGHIYARECCASIWYAKGAIRYLAGATDDVRPAYEEALSRVPGHPMVRAGLAILDGRAPELALQWERTDDAPLHIDDAMGRAAILVHAGRPDAAADVYYRALRTSPPGNAGWLMPIDPLLQVQRHKALWKRGLDLLHHRAIDWLL